MVRGCRFVYPELHFYREYQQHAGACVYLPPACDFSTFFTIFCSSIRKARTILRLMGKLSGEQRATSRGHVVRAARERLEPRLEPRAGDNTAAARRRRRDDGRPSSRRRANARQRRPSKRARPRRLRCPPLPPPTFATAARSWRAVDARQGEARTACARSQRISSHRTRATPSFGAC